MREVIGGRPFIVSLWKFVDFLNTWIFYVFLKSTSFHSTFLSYYHLHLFPFITKLLDNVVNWRFSLFHFFLSTHDNLDVTPPKQLAGSSPGTDGCNRSTASLSVLPTLPLCFFQTPPAVPTLLPSAPEPFHDPGFLPALLVALLVTLKGCSCRKQGSSWSLPFPFTPSMLPCSSSLPLDIFMTILLSPLPFAFRGC